MGDYTLKNVVEFEGGSKKELLDEVNRFCKSHILAREESDTYKGEVLKHSEMFMSDGIFCMNIYVYKKVKDDAK